jgi:hypothetical protein
LEPDTPGAFATNMDAKSASNSVSTAEDICVCVCVVICVFSACVKAGGKILYYNNTTWYDTSTVFVLS